MSRSRGHKRQNDKTSMTSVGPFSKIYLVSIMLAFVHYYNIPYGEKKQMKLYQFFYSAHKFSK